MACGDDMFGNSKDKNNSTEFKMEGNKFYIEFDYRNASVSYNKALCCAEIGSEDIGIIYANRSAVALEMKLYPECLKNIQLARQHKYPSKLLVKLNEREKKCLELISRKKTTNENPETLIELWYRPEPFVSDCLEIVHRKNEKPYIITNRDLKVGEKIAVQNPFVGFLMANSLYLNCSNCSKECPFDLIPCDGCRSAMFCTEKCKNSALEFHKYERGYLDRMIFASDSNEDLAINYFRALLKALSLFNGSVAELKQFVEKPNELLTMDIFVNEKSFLKSYNFLSDILDKPAKLEMKSLLAYYPKIQKMLVNKNLRNFVIRFLSKLSTTIVLRNKHENEQNGGFYPLETVLTMSCAPNVTGIVLSDGKIMYFVQYPIEAGAKLTIDYGMDNGSKNRVYYAFLSKTERREKIFQYFQIKCECVACEENYPMRDQQNIISSPSVLDANYRFTIAHVLTGIAAFKMFNENSQLIHDYSDEYPCLEITLLMLANVALLRTLLNLL